MPQVDIIQSVLSGTAPKNLRILIARGSAPISAQQNLELVVHLLRDPDSDVASHASRTLSSWDREELLAQLSSTTCPVAVLEHFADHDRSDAVMQAIVTNPAAPGSVIEKIASCAPAALVERILDNRIRIIQHPAILESIRKNHLITADIRRLIQEIDSEFFGSKKKDYAVETPADPSPAPGPLAELEADESLDDFSLEGLPVEGEDRQAELNKRLSCLSVRQKIQQALFGNREIRAVLVRDTNKEVARSVLRSPKLTENEVESIAAMRGVAEDILRDIGTSREWTKNYSVVQNLVKNPKTPPVVSQRLLFRLLSRDLMLLTRDRSVPDAVRQNATRALRQRTATRS